MKPSAFYRGELWGAAVRLANAAPRAMLEPIAGALCTAYSVFNSTRRRVVFNNLLPLVHGSETRAEELTESLFWNFGRKLVHLWQFEGGQPVDRLLRDPVGWPQFMDAYGRKQGVILLTPHLGNWEFGALLLARRGIKMQAISFQEPHAGLTELRQKGRERWGVETVFIGENPFAFIQVIRNLEQGGVVALLVDRPPRNGIPTTLCGRSLLASNAAAELARATGSALLPVTIVYDQDCYRARIDEEIHYDRAALRAPDARAALTQRIMSQLEPHIRAHADQWYHFVPIWNESSLRS